MSEIPFERVYTVSDYWDGPRLGAADYRGAPHVYKALFMVDLDEWDATQFYLSPLSEQALALVLEDWAIWKRFELAYKAGDVGWTGEEDEWGALPAELARRRELSPAVAAALNIDPSRCIVASGTFRAAATDEPHPPLGVLRVLEVCWTDLEIIPQVI